MNVNAKYIHRRKSGSWVDSFLIDLRSEFNRLRAVGVKFNYNVLRLLTSKLLGKSDNGVYGTNLIDPRSGKPQADKNRHTMYPIFFYRFHMIQQLNGEKPKFSVKKLIQFGKETKKHLGKLKKGFSSCDYKEQDMSKAEKTNFVFNIDNCKTLLFSGDKEVKYGDVTSGGDGMKMLLNLSCVPNAQIESALLIFTNQVRSYPISGVTYNTPEFAYRTRPRRSINSINMLDWLCQARVIKYLPNNRIRHLFIDNCNIRILNE